MHFEPDTLYHIYNRSNETIFFSRENYLFFLKRVKEYLFPNCRILAWVLMPNHFHFLVQTNQEGCQYTNEAHRPHLQKLTKEFGRLLSSYTQAINRQENRRGKLFSHDTKAKNLHEIVFVSALSGFKRMTHNSPDYATNCFLYLHQNPVIAGLVSKLEDWEFSSFRDYAGLRTGKLVDY